MTKIYIVHGGDTADGTSRIQGVFANHQDAMNEYNKKIQEDICGLSLIEEIDDSYDEDTEAYDKRFEGKDVATLDIPGLEYTYTETNISNFDRTITYYLSEENIQ